ncbi:MAG TPA: hypothetical protein VFG69_11995 [Nannocystaceae bacterium]|nr:hypothetical protein [Nannocystaceae bacterium]
MSREALVRETLRLPWSEVLATPPVPTKVIVAKPLAQVIGVVVPLRGTWWGMAVTRCDRAIADQIAAVRGTGRYGDFDVAVRWLGLELAKAVRRTVDLTAELGDAIVLAGDEAHWVPKNGMLHTEACFRVGDGNLVVSAFERTRSDRRTPPTITSPHPRAPLATTGDDPAHAKARSRSRESA